MTDLKNKIDCIEGQIAELEQTSRNLERYLDTLPVNHPEEADLIAELEDIDDQLKDFKDDLRELNDQLFNYYFN
jgi:uncharacterized coiled-coil DUF342 family protein